MFSNSNLPGQGLPRRLGKTKTAMAAPSYTCEAEIRKKVSAAIRAKADALQSEPQGGDEMIDNWVKFVCAKTAENGNLISNRQFQDWVLGRRLAVGDRVRFIGAEREEVSSDGGTSRRPMGQVGVIAALDKVDRDTLATFYPHDPVFVTGQDGEVAQKIVNLVVRSGTKEWWDLERVG